MKNTNYHIIVFRNVKNGEYKEYYIVRAEDEIEEKARQLRDEFFNKEDIEIHIYTLSKRIGCDE